MGTLNLVRGILLQPLYRPALSRKEIRLHELDGLRGWAALSVVLFHIFWEVFGRIVPIFRSPLTSFFLDGRLAVTIFFILSGEALSAAYFSGKGEAAVIRLALKRYWRLTIPIAFSGAIVFALIKIGAVYNGPAGALVRRDDWLSNFLQIPVTPVFFLQDAFLNVYLPQRHLVNPILWTMTYEMQGSILVFAILLTLRYIKFPWLVILAISAILIVSTPHSCYYACFLVGLLFSAARTHGFFQKIQDLRWGWYASWALVILAAILDGRGHLNEMGPSRTVMCAVPLLFGIFSNKTISNFLASKFSQILGKLSFPIYLIQFPVLLSFTSGAIVYRAAHGGLSLGAVWVIAIFSLAVCLVGAFLFLPIEGLAKWTGSAFARLLYPSKNRLNVKLRPAARIP